MDLYSFTVTITTVRIPAKSLKPDHSLEHWVQISNSQILSPENPKRTWCHLMHQTSVVTFLVMASLLFQAYKFRIKVLHLLFYPHIQLVMKSDYPCLYKVSLGCPHISIAMAAMSILFLPSPSCVWS